MEPELREYKRLERRSEIARDLHSPKYRKRVIQDKRRKANRLACRRRAA